MINACWLGRRRRGYFVSRFPEPGSNQAQVGPEEARAAAHGLPLCCVRDHAVCPVALVNDDLAATDRAVTMLVELATVELATASMRPWGLAGSSPVGLSGPLAHFEPLCATAY